MQELNFVVTENKNHLKLDIPSIFFCYQLKKIFNLIQNVIHKFETIGGFHCHGPRYVSCTFVLYQFAAHLTITAH